MAKRKTNRKSRPPGTNPTIEWMLSVSTVDPQTDCWVWGKYKHEGYGRIHVSGKSCIQAHRHAYELVKGPIPDGCVIDHLCRNRACFNPDHLEAVSSEENIRRGIKNVLYTPPTHCKNGHPFGPPDNDPITKPGTKSWICRICRTAAVQRNSRIYSARRRNPNANPKRVAAGKASAIVRYGVVYEPS